MQAQLPAPSPVLLLALRMARSLEELAQILLVLGAPPAHEAPAATSRTVSQTSPANRAAPLPRPILSLARCAASRFPAESLAPQPTRAPSWPTRLFLTTAPGATCCW